MQPGHSGRVNPKPVTPSQGILGPVHRYIHVFMVSAVSLVLFWRLLSFTLNNSVNILFWDQWDFYNAFFENHTLWQIFDWQHGPHRQGLGLVFTWLLTRLTHWNSRADAVAVVGVLFGATVLALYLKRRLFGPLEYADLIIPFLFLTRSQYESLVGTSNLSHGPFPLLLMMLICLAWLQPNRLTRYSLVLSLNFLMTFTGFGLFMGVITPLLLGVECHRAARAKQNGALAEGMAALAISFLSFGSFFIGYKFDPAVSCFHFPFDNVWAYPWYVGLMFSNVFGLKGNLDGVSTIGITILVCAIALLVYHVMKIWRTNANTKDASWIISILLSYSLLFGFNTAIGRVCLGMDTADSSRYVPYMVMGLLGIYFHLLTLDKTTARNVVLVGCVAVSAIAGLYLTEPDQRLIAWYSNGKREWRACYLQTESIEDCNTTTNFQVYPWPDILREKLAYLKRNKLNLYIDAQ
jgi:hypothetical protein